MKNKPQLPPTALVIFGAAGDLTWRKLVPALYDLFLDDLLPDKFAIFGVDGKAITIDDWRMRLENGVKQFSRHQANGRNSPFISSTAWPAISKNPTPSIPWQKH